MFQIMKDHLVERATVGAPFQSTGVDVAGPWAIRSSNGRILLKRWVAVFVCLRCRGIHVEVLEDMTSRTFINALARFHARRGGLRSLWSDNGTNLTGANRMLLEAWEEWRPAALDYMRKHGLTWTFAPPRCPTWGGAFERVIGLFKKALQGTVHGSGITPDDFHTLIVSAERSPGR